VLWNTREGQLHSLQLTGEASSAMEFVLLVGMERTLQIEVAT